MKLLSETQLRATAIICPILILAGIYNLGYLFGYILYLDFSHLTMEQAFRITTVVLAIIATVVFVKRFKALKQHFFNIDS